MKRNSNYFYLVTVTVCFCVVDVISAAGRATPCRSRLALLDGDELLRSPVTDNRLTSTSHTAPYTASEVRMSGDGWCASSICNVGMNTQYLQVDFGAEVVVEAIAIESVEEFFYVTKFYVEYGSDLNQLFCVVSEGSNSTVFDGVNICRQRTDADVKNFMYPVTARYIRVVPLAWESVAPCLRLELYGCYVKECSRIRDVSNNANLLPVANINFSSYLSDQYMDLSVGWCISSSRDSSPHVNLTFTQPLYILYAVVRGDGSDYVDDFSYIYENSLGERISYANVDQESNFGLISPADQTFLLWTPINTSRLHLRMNEFSTSFGCIGIDLWGCTYRDEVIDHEVSATTTGTAGLMPCMASSVQQQTAVVTVTTTVSVPITTIVTMTTSQTASITSSDTMSATPQSSCDCSDRQQISSSSSDDSDVVTICVPVAIVVGVIILIVLIVIAIVVWMRTKVRRASTPFVHKSDRQISSTSTVVHNDLYGMEPTFTGKSLSSIMEEEPAKYNNPIAIQQDQPMATYETVSLHEDKQAEANSGGTTNPIYAEVNTAKSNAVLQHNPSYQPLETTDHA